MPATSATTKQLLNVSPSSRAGHNTSNTSTTPNSSPEKYWPVARARGGTKTTPVKLPNNMFEALPSSTSMSRVRANAGASFTEEELTRQLSAYHASALKSLKGRKRTLSNLSSSSSSSDSDEEQNNDGEDHENDDDDTSSSDSCSSTSSSGSDSSESSSDSSDCDDNDDDNDDDDYDSENSESKSNLMLTPSMKKHLDLMQVSAKEEEWGFAAVAKSNADIFANSSSSNSSNQNNNNQSGNEAPKPLKRTDDFSAMSKENKEIGSQIQSRKLHSQAAEKTVAAAPNIVAASPPKIELQQQKVTEISPKSKPNAASTTATAAAIAQEDKTKVNSGATMMIRYKPKTAATDSSSKEQTATATTAQALPQKKVALLKSMPLEKKPEAKPAALDEDEEDIPYLSHKNIIRYKMLENIDIAKGELPAPPHTNIVDADAAAKEAEEKQPWEVVADENPFDSQPLPNGVSQADYEVYKKIRERARKTIVGAMESPSKLITKSSTAATATAERCPGSIEIGKWHITW